ncbi:MAG: hypothetical protein NTW52_07470 [Planctomycetota bacterium]|nr:hypothetical protein [Planctomycetota bacterium]
MIASRLKTVRAVVVTCGAVAIMLIIYQWIDKQLGRTDYYTGFTLLAASIGLMTLSMRKKLIVLPLGSVAVWQQVHQYLGLFAVATFMMHAGFPVHGILETALSVIFVLISLSGSVGWYINKTTPRKLLAAGQAVLREDIATMRRSIAQQAYHIALTAAGKIESATLADHYTQRLSDFFSRRRSIAYCLVPTGRSRRELLHGLEKVSRHLGPEGRSCKQTLSELVIAKDDLDFQWAMQIRLRSWVIFHVSLVWSFFILVAYHIYLVYRYKGG